MRNIFIWFVILVLLGAVIVLSKDYVAEQAEAWLNPAEEDTVPTIQIQARDYQLRIPTRGELSGLQTIPVMTPRVRTGSLKISWMVNEGSLVRKDQTVITFDETDAKLSLEESENRHSSFSYQIDQTEENSKGELEVLAMEQAFAETELGFAQSQIRKDEEIFSRWEIQESVMSAALAEYKKNVFSRKIELQQGLTESDLQILNIDQQRAQMDMNLAKETLSSLIVTAPVDGIIIYQRRGFDELEIGSDVWPGQPLAEIASLQQFKGKIQVTEKDIGAVAKDQLVDIRLDAYPERAIAGKVQNIARIAKQVHREDPRKYFECELLLDVPIELMGELKPGMQFSAEINGGTWKQAFVVPKSAVIKQEKGWIIFVSKGEEYEERNVEIISNDYGFFLVSGLQEGEIICLQHPFEKKKLTLPDFNAPAAPTQQMRFVIMG